MSTVCVKLHEVHDAQSSTLLRFLSVGVLLLMSAISSASVSSAGLLRIQSYRSFADLCTVFYNK